MTLYDFSRYNNIISITYIYYISVRESFCVINKTIRKKQKGLFSLCNHNIFGENPTKYLLLGSERS